MTEQPTATGHHTASSVDRIIEATLGLIAERGLGAVTMVEVAETAGVARQTVYNHFPDVDGIVAEAIGRHNRESIALLDAALGVVDTPEDELVQLVRHTVAIGAHASHRGIERGLSADARDALGDYDRALDDRIRRILEVGRTAGTFRPDIDPDTDAVLIRHLLAGLAHQAATDVDTSDLAATGARTVLAAVTRHPSG